MICSLIYSLLASCVILLANGQDLTASDLKPTVIHRFGLHFHAFTKDNPNDSREIELGSVESLQNSGLVQGQPITIYVHGFRITSDISPQLKLKDLYLENGFTNVIMLEWENTPPIIGEIQGVNYVTYFGAIWKYLPKACNTFTKFIHFLSQNGFGVEHLHLVGASLGAHLMGCTGKRYTTKYGEKIQRITALDPAKPFRKTIPMKNQLSKDAAKFVDVFHTDILFLGIPEPLGHVDFYPNGGIGSEQPGCLSVFPSLCAHLRATQIFMYTIITTTKLHAFPCNEDSTDNLGTVCMRPEIFDRRERVLAGEYVNKRLRGKYYLPTRNSDIQKMRQAGIPIQSVNSN